MRTEPTAEQWPIVHLATEVIRPPAEYYNEDGVLVVTFDPPLSVEEQAIYDALPSLLAMQRPMSLTTYQQVRPSVQTLRDLRQMGRNAFMALSAAERDRASYDAHVAITEILLAILRD